MAKVLANATSKATTWLGNALKSLKKTNTTTTKSKVTTYDNAGNKITSKNKVTTNTDTGNTVKTNKTTVTPANKVNTTSETVSSLGKTALKTAGVTGGVLGTTYLLSNSGLSSLFSSDDSGNEGGGGGDNNNGGDGETILSDEDKKSIVDEILNYLNGGENGGGYAVVPEEDSGLGIVEEASSTITQYLPWVLGGLVVILILSAMSSNPDTAKAEAVKA